MKHTKKFLSLLLTLTLLAGYFLLPGAYNGSLRAALKMPPTAPCFWPLPATAISSNIQLKQLVVSMLNYGAAAQLYFGHNTDALANASLTGEHLAQAIYVAAVYSDGTTTWTSGVLGYSIGAYCGSLATKGGTMADLAMATAVYGYHAKAYFG